MIVDFFIKPLQGKRFMKLRDMILNISSEFEDLGTSLEHRSMLDNSMKNAEVLRHWNCLEATCVHIVRE
jgi:hypothetical protein